MDAFDADVLIYAAVPGHRLGTPVLALFPEEPPDTAGIFAGVGSTLLLVEMLTKPTGDAADEEVAALATLLARLDLRPVDEAIALLAVALGASYRLRSADAVHLATAVSTGADRFITNNRRDFSQSIEEVSVTYPTDLL
ncbi:MAG: type II toxin-antitoxin system VapC family toxin [Acidimicrobiales bacterium]